MRVLSHATKLIRKIEVEASLDIFLVLEKRHH